RPRRRPYNGSNGGSFCRTLAEYDSGAARALPAARTRTLGLRSGRKREQGRVNPMKAILYTDYGPPDVLQLPQLEKPSPKDNEVLVKVLASSINALEWRRFTMPRIFLPIFGGGLREPKDKTIGGDLAGRVEAVGAAVKRFRPGDEVFGVRRGAFAEYVCAS